MTFGNYLENTSDDALLGKLWASVVDGGDLSRIVSISFVYFFSNQIFIEFVYY